MGISVANKYDRYSAKAVSHDWGKSQKKSTDYVEVCFEVTDGEAKGRRFPWQGYFTKSTEERTLQSLQYAGCTFPGGDLTNLSGLGDKIVEIQVEQTDFGPRVAWVNEPRAGSVTEETRLSAGDKKSLAARMKGKLLAMQRGGAPAAKSATAKAPDPWEQPAAPQAPANDASEPPAKTGTDDDIPF